MRPVSIVLLSAALLAGCGYKGPLYLPGSKAEKPKRGPVVTPRPAPEPALPAEAAPAPR